MHTTSKKEITGTTCLRSFASRLGSLLLTLVLCMGLLPPAAWAEESVVRPLGALAGEATLTIVFGLDPGGDPDVALNMKYEFETGATLEDLFDHAVAQGDLQAYELNSYGYIKSITKTDGTKLEAAADWSTYWSIYVDGSYYGGVDTVETMILEDGTTYQFAWESYPPAVIPNLSGCGYSFADDYGDEIGSGTIDTSVALYFIYGGTSLLHYVYGVSSGTTLEQLLDGVRDEIGDIDDFKIDAVTGYLTSLEFFGWIRNAVDGSSRWALFIDGVYCDEGTGDIRALVLENGKAYQFIFVTYPTALPPVWSALAPPSTGAGIVEGTGGGTPPLPPALVAPYSQSLFDELYVNIAARYKGTGEEWNALELAALGDAVSVDKAAIIAKAIAAYNAPDTTNLQRSIITLNALGIDPRSVISGGGSYDLIAKLAATPISTNTTNGVVFALLAYASGPFVPPPGALKDIDMLIGDLLALQNADGGWSFTPGTSDADMTAMGITALTPYRTYPGVEAMIQQALATLHSMQLPNGGFSNPYDADLTAVNISSTAMVIIALSAAGIDVQTWLVTSGSNAHSPLSALLSQANSSKNGFLFSGVTNSMATEQGFRALVAYQGFLNTRAAFNVYTQAGSGLARPNLSGGTGLGTGTGSTATGMPATGDGTPSMLVLIAALGICGLCVIVVSRRRSIVENPKRQQ